MSREAISDVVVIIIGRMGSRIPAKGEHTLHLLKKVMEEEELVVILSL